MADKKDTIEPISGTFEDVVSAIAPKATQQTQPESVFDEAFEVV